MVDVTIEQLHWNQLRKQFLLGEKVSDFYEVAKTQLGLHSTDYWTPYLSVWARLGNYDAKSVFESINNGKLIVRTHAFRKTLHVVHLDNLSVILSATGPALFNASRNDRYRKTNALSDKDIEDLLRQVVSALESGPLSMSELKKRVDPAISDYVRSALIMLMAKGDVVRAKAKHARSNLTSYALLRKWAHGFKLEFIEESTATSHLIRSHIDRFGPVSIDDIAWWFKQTKTTVKNTIGRMKEDVVALELDGTEKFMMTADLETASSIEVPTDDNVWFLPYEDHFLKAFIDRNRFISAEIQHRISPPDRRHFWPSKPDEPRVMPSPGVRATGEVRPTIWYNGNVVGRWEIDDIGKEKRIVTSLYTKLDKLGIESIEEKRMDLDCFVNSILLPISGGK